MNSALRKSFVAHCVKKNVACKRKGTKALATRPNTCSYVYHLKRADGTYVRVCKTCFVSTVGFTKQNDNIIKETFKHIAPGNQAVPGDFEDRRKYNGQTQQFNHQTIRNHIESYHPTVSHYRRAHAPNRRYLPSDDTIIDMYRQFIDSGKGSCSYINEFKRMNVSMTKHGH